MGKVYRVLAADDERWSRENIRKLISWETYSLEFLEPACDGEEVLERIPKENPDIILTDINMPFMDGLELLDRLSNEYPEIITVAISGYDDFEKVKGVFKSGGLDYLLKPIGKEALVEVLTKAFATLEQRENDKIKESNNISKEKKMSSYIQDNEYSSLLRGKLYSFQKQIHITSTTAFSELSMILVKFHDIEILSQKYEHDILQMSYSIKEKLKQILDDKQSMIFNYSDKVNEFIMVVNMTPERLLGSAKDICSFFDITKDGPITVVIHDQASSLDDIGTVYREMIAMLVTRSFKKEHCILKCGSYSTSETSQGVLGKLLLSKITEACISGQRGQLRELIFESGGFSKCEENEWSYFDASQYITRVITTLSENGHFENEIVRKQMTDEISEAVNYGIRSIDKKLIAKNIEIFIDAICGDNNTQDYGSISSQVGYAHDYIEKNFDQNLTLSMLSDKYHVNPSYLSSIFSQKYGKTITTFIMEMRIGRAKELLKNEDKKLEEISFEIGYDDYNYFSRVFRKNTGISPSEYRKGIIGAK